MNKPLIVLIEILTLLFSIRLYPQESLLISRPEDTDGQMGQRAEIIMTEAYSRLGISISFIDFPIKRTLYEVNKGNTDGELSRVGGLEKDFENIVMVPYPIQYTEVVIFTKINDLPEISWNNVSDYRVGIVRGFIFAEKKMEGKKYESAQSMEIVFAMLQSGRIDIIIDLRSSLFKIRKLGYNEIHIVEPPIDSFPLYVIGHFKSGQWWAVENRPLQI